MVAARIYADVILEIGIEGCVVRPVGRDKGSIRPIIHSFLIQDFNECSGGRVVHWSVGDMQSVGVVFIAPVPELNFDYIDANGRLAVDAAWIAAVTKVIVVEIVDPFAGEAWTGISHIQFVFTAMQG